MQIRTFLTILGALALVAFLAILARPNQALLDQPFQISPTRVVPLWTILVGTYLTGVLTFLVVFLLRGSADLAERWRMLQGRRAGRAVDDLYNRGMEAILEGRDEKALEYFQSILSREPENHPALLRAGAVMRSLKRHAEAVELHKRAHRLHDTDLEPLYELVKDYEAMEQVGKSKVVLNRIIQLRPRRALSAYRKLRKYAIAESEWARAWELQGLIEEQMEKTPYKREAEHRFSIGLRYEMACAAAREHKEKDALNALRKLTRSDVGFIPAHLKLGETLKLQGHADQAVQVWESGFEQTGSPVFLTMIEEHYLSEEDPEGAIRAAQTAVTRARKDFMPRFFLAKLYLRLEMIDEAHREFRALAARATASPTMHAFLGSVLERRGEHREAAAHYRQVITGLDYLKLQYRCQICEERFASWRDRCGVCGEWNQIALDFGEDPTLEDLGLSPGPVYSQTA